MWYHPRTVGEGAIYFGTKKEPLEVNSCCVPYVFRYRNGEDVSITDNYDYLFFSYPYHREAPKVALPTKKDGQLWMTYVSESLPNNGIPTEKLREMGESSSFFLSSLFYFFSIYLSVSFQD